MSPSQSYMMLGFLLLVDLPLLKAPLVMKKFSPIASKHDAAVSLIFFFFLPSLGFLSFFGLSFFGLSFLSFVLSFLFFLSFFFLPPAPRVSSSTVPMPLVDRPEPKLKPWLVAAALTSGSADTVAWCSPNMPVWSSLVPLGRASSLLGRLNFGGVVGRVVRVVVLVVVLVVVVDSVDVVVVVVVQSTVVGSISFHFLRLGSCVWAFTAKTPRRKVANFILPSFLPC